MPHCYILYSKTLDKYYVGSSNLDPVDRLDNHLSQFYGANKFTAKAEDWKIFHSIECESIRQARKIESHIKKMKSKKYIRNLIVYKDLIEKLKDKYSQIK